MFYREDRHTMPQTDIATCKLNRPSDQLSKRFLTANYNNYQTIAIFNRVFVISNYLKSIMTFSEKAVKPKILRKMDSKFKISKNFNKVLAQDWC